jgi:hypothetical protein
MRMNSKNIAIFVSLTYISVGCRTTDVRVAAKVKDARASDLSATPLDPPIDSVVSGEAWLPRCGTIVGCPADANQNEVGCAATNGTLSFRSLEGLNNCLDGLKIQRQICQRGLDPASFHSACFSKKNVDRDPLTPPIGTVVSGKAWLPACGMIVGCPADANQKEVGCAATNGTHSFKSMDGLNNCSDGLKIQRQICQKGLNPAKFKSVCFVKP